MVELWVKEKGEGEGWVLLRFYVNSTKEEILVFVDVSQIPKTDPSTW